MEMTQEEKDFLQLLQGLKDSDPESFNRILSELSGNDEAIEKQEDKDKDKKSDEVEKEKKDDEKDTETMEKIAKALLNLKVEKQEGADTADTKAEDLIENLLDEDTVAGIEEVAKSCGGKSEGKNKVSKSLSGLLSIAKAQGDRMIEAEKSLEFLFKALGVDKQIDAVEEQEKLDEEKKKKEEETAVEAKKTEAIVKAVVEANKALSTVPMNSPEIHSDSFSRSEAVKKSVNIDVLKALKANKA